MSDTPVEPERNVPLRSGSFAARLFWVCEALAVFGGLMLLGVTAFTVASVVGRTALDSPILGDQEIVELGCAIALFSFMPYCQMRSANIIVEFFTAGLPASTRALIDAVMNAIFSVCIVIVTWRLAVGGIASYTGGDTTMFLRMPLWWGYLGGFVGCIAWSLACLYSVFRSLREALDARAAAAGGVR